jgi:phenylacetic acid degradation operon negative regulatory protein
MPLTAPLTDLLASFRAAKPVRAWSLIITLYGDAVVPRGGRLWLGSLIEIMALFGIDAGHVRTAMSRLTSEGWLERERIGRNSYYRLSRREEGSFVAATRRIYFPETVNGEGKLRLALLGPGLNDRRITRSLLEQAGFVQLSALVYVALGDPPAPVVEHEGLFVLSTEPGGAGAAVAAAAWKLAPIAEAYRSFILQFTPIETALVVGGNPSGPDALVIRTLLIHEFRRIVLRYPALPAALLPQDWPGQAARALAARIYAHVVAPAESFLTETARNEVGPLPAPEPSFAHRLSTTSIV